MREEYALKRIMISVVVLFGCFMVLSFLWSKHKDISNKAEEIEYRVMTAEKITVKEKYISSGSLFTEGSPFLVLTDGTDSFSIKVTETIYNSYQPGDEYRHDADQKLYDTTTSEGP